MIRHATIAGGGIAGAAAALALRKAGIDVTVIERRPADDDTGAFLRLNPNGLDALHAIDALTPVENASFPLRYKERLSREGELLAREPITDPDTNRNFSARFITWTALQRTLRVEATRHGATFRDGTSVTGVDHDGVGMQVHLSDGRLVDTDMLVGADGTHSHVRTMISASAPTPEYRGSRTIYGLTLEPSADIPPAYEMLRSYKGKSLFLAYTTAPTGQCYWFTNLKDTIPQSTPFPTTGHWRDHLLDLLRNDDNPIAQLVADATQIRAADDRALAHLPRWHADDMVVIGDAAHAAPPGSEQGGSLAIEDAVVLAQCLRDLPVSQALAHFEAIRRPRVEAIIARATGRAVTTSETADPYLHRVVWENQRASQDTDLSPIRRVAIR